MNVQSKRYPKIEIKDDLVDLCGSEEAVLIIAEAKGIVSNLMSITQEWSAASRTLVSPQSRHCIHIISLSKQ